MTATLNRSTQVAKTTRTTVTRDQVEDLLTDAAYVLQLARRVRGEIIRSAVQQACEARQGIEVG